jgi:hypothetical protein
VTEQNPRLDGRTKRALDMAIARKQVSQDSYRAVLAGEITLQRAKELGRSGAPTDTPQASDGPGTVTETPGRGGTEGTNAPARRCLCGCGQRPRSSRSRFVQGHDHRLYGELKRNLEKDPLLRNERFSEEQKAYARERGLLDG